MKYIYKLVLSVCCLSALLTACNKVDDLPVYANGNAPVLTSSLATVAPTAADSLSTVISFSWTNPKFAADTATFKYVLQIDSAGRNFSSPVSKTVTGSLGTALTGKELNAILLGFGFNYNVAYDIDVRVIASYANNNDRQYSNVVRIKATPYVTPPKIIPPATGKLFLVGGATDGGWDNPVPTPFQEFGKIDSVTYVGVFHFNGGGEYLLLPQNGSWDTKFSVADNTLPGLNTGGDFGVNLDKNFPAPTAAGMYKITVDFQRGKFTVVPYMGPPLPANLFIVGDATPGGWDNPVPAPSQQFTRLNSVEYVINSLTINPGKEYLLLPVNGSWDNKYALSDNGLPGISESGYFGYNFAQNFKGPLTAGNYKIYINFGISSPAAGAENTAYFKTTKL